MKRIQVGYRVEPAIFAPIVLTIAAIFLAAGTLWSLAAIPFIFLGSICAAPNFNLANGCLAWVAILVGFGVMLLHRELGGAIFVGTATSWLLSGIEKRLRMKPLFEDEIIARDSSRKL